MPAVSYSSRLDGKREFKSTPSAADRPALNPMQIVNELEAAKATVLEATIWQSVDLSTLLTDASYIGQTRVDGTVAENALGAGAALRVNQYGQYVLASADAETLCPCVALALEDGTGVKKVLTDGWFRKFSWSFTPGALLFLDLTSGLISSTRPTGENKMVQILGYAEAPSIIRFRPSLNLIKLVE
ncbi:MAG: hypothetical protein LHW56_01705 [Candidatus Cloacimonetes bacterium]|nr:hypothetical protein [Candidatus Cloacimonadota bacterium]MDY0171603.1 hypothetical protein [Candidatus Cloacimonadaceae bacterium]